MGHRQGYCGRFYVVSGSYHRQERWQHCCRGRSRGEISHPGVRVTYTLDLGTDTVITIRAIPAGMRTNNSRGLAFNPMVLVYDKTGHLLAANNETAFDDETLFDATVKGLSLAAGSYSIEVRGVLDVVTGPYRLAVVSAE